MVLMLLACVDETADTGQPTVRDTSCETAPYFLDQDGDGLGIGDPEYRCEPGGGFTATTDDDCWDTDPQIGAEGLFLITSVTEELTEQASGDEPFVHTIEEASTLVVCGGSYSIAFQVDAALTVQGVGEASLRAQGQRLFTATAPLSVTRVDLLDGFSTEDGGAIFSTSDVTLTDLRVANASALSGGGVYQTGTDGSLTLDGVTMEDNQATADGGAAVVEGDLIVTDSIFLRNTAVNGGAFHLGIGTSSFTGSALSENTADRGGALDLRPPHHATVTDSQLTQNVGSFGGAFATWETARLDCVDSAIHSNTADTRGGGAWLLPTEGATSLTSSGCDWGDGDTDNFRDDVYNTQTAYVGTAGDWTCVGVTCSL